MAEMRMMGKLLNHIKLVIIEWMDAFSFIISKTSWTDWKIRDKIIRDSERKMTMYRTRTDSWLWFGTGRHQSKRRYKLNVIFHKGRKDFSNETLLALSPLLVSSIELLMTISFCWTLFISGQVLGNKIIKTLLRSTIFKFAGLLAAAENTAMWEKQYLNVNV